MNNNQKRKSTKKPSAAAKEKNKNQYEWLVNKLENKDPYFSVDLGV